MGTRRTIAAVLISAVLCGCLLSLCLPAVGGPTFLFETAFHLTLGWIVYLVRTLPHVTIDWSGVVTFAGLLAAFAFVLHGFCRALRRAQFGDHDGAPAWKRRWTFGVTGLTLTLFLAGLAATGVGHQVGWMATAPVPMLESSRSPGRRRQSQTNLKRIALAAHNFHGNRRRFPAGGTYGPAGQGRHGWVTRSLPYLDHEALHARIDFGRPWSDPINREPLTGVIEPLRSPAPDHPEADADGYALAHYAGNAFVMTDGRGLRLVEVADGVTQTLLAGEVAANFLPWGHPANTRDPSVGIDHPHGFGGPTPGGCQVVLCDGSVTFLSESIDPAVLRALSTPAGGEAVDSHGW